jgi:hypothetical protein
MPIRHLLLESRCWSCETMVTRLVHPLLRRSNSLSWSCADCEVSWTGAGQDAEAG